MQRPLHQNQREYLLEVQIFGPILKRYRFSESGVRPNKSNFTTSSNKLMYTSLRTAALSLPLLLLPTVQLISVFDKAVWVSE